MVLRARVSPGVSMKILNSAGINRCHSRRHMRGSRYQPPASDGDKVEGNHKPWLPPAPPKARRARQNNKHANSLDGHMSASKSVPPPPGAIVRGGVGSCAHRPRPFVLYSSALQQWVSSTTPSRPLLRAEAQRRRLIGSVQHSGGAATGIVLCRQERDAGR